MFHLPVEILYMIPIIVLAYAANAMIGFGAPLVAITLGANFIPVELLVPSLVPLSVIAPGIVALRHRAEINTGLLLKQVLPFVGSGLILGLTIYPLLKGVNLKCVLGVIVVLFSVRELFAFGNRLGRASQPQRWVIGCWQVLAGIIHATYITGGPLVVYSLGRLGLTKGVFRSTLCSIWASLNVLLVLVFIMNGRINVESLKITGPLILFLPLGIVLGERLHDRFNPELFQIIIYAVLIGAGIKLIIS